MIPVVTIDGPSGSGKGTLASRIADHYHFHLLDSGAFYRILALASLQQEQHLKTTLSESALAELAHTLVIEFIVTSNQMVVLLNQVDVTQAIRAEHVGLQASKIATFPAVRDALLKQQQRSARAPGLVADGRDMGTVVFPDAPVKFFLTASAEARATRRFDQLNAQGVADVNLNVILQDLVERDTRDSNRATAPLKPAVDAIVIDASFLTIDEVFMQMTSAIDLVLV